MYILYEEATCNRYEKYCPKNRQYIIKVPLIQLNIFYFIISLNCIFFFNSSVFPHFYPGNDSLNENLYLPIHVIYGCPTWKKKNFSGSLNGIHIFNTYDFCLSDLFIIYIAIICWLWRDRLFEFFFRKKKPSWSYCMDIIRPKNLYFIKIWYMALSIK